MISLRRRLTISYTVIVGAFIALVALVLAWVALDAVVRPIQEAITAGANEARDLAIAEPSLTGFALVARLRQAIGRKDVLVLARRAPGVPGDSRLGRPAGPPPDGLRRPPPGGAFHPPGDPGALPAPLEDGPQFNPTAFLGLHAEFVAVNGTQIAIVPNLPRLVARMRGYVLILIGLLGVSLFVAWVIARWIAAQAVAPLIDVTEKLQRFAGGDFTPHAVSRGGVSDVGQLIEAYNGAAAQVAAAFDERERAEQRMRRFLADAGHELRTPLSIVIAYLDVLRKGGVDDPHLRDRAFATLATETTRMRRLVERLVALARLEQPETTQPAVVDLGALARDAVDAIVAARGGDVRCAVESGTFVLADPSDLHEAITNLVDNAIKYGAGSPVRVAVEHELDAVAVRVTDRGPGIAPGDREKIFERFYRGAARETIDGSGLGLAIATRAAERAGGRLSLDRADGGTTMFTLRVPLYVAAAVV